MKKITDKMRLDLMLSGNITCRLLETGLTEVYHGSSDKFFRKNDPRKAIDCALRREGKDRRGEP